MSKFFVPVAWEGAGFLYSFSRLSQARAEYRKNTLSQPLTLNLHLRGHTTNLQSEVSGCEKGFVKCFQKVHLVCLGSTVAAVQPNSLRNSQKTFYKIFFTYAPDCTYGKKSTLTFLLPGLGMSAMTTFCRKPARSNLTLPDLICASMTSCADPSDSITASWIFHHCRGRII